MEVIKDKRIETFFTAAEQGSFSKAAKQLFISQPALSQHILSLEKEIGVSLFDRTPTGVFLTKEGEYLYRELKPLADQWDETIWKVKKRKTTNDKKLVIGIRPDGDLPITDFITPLYKTVYPDVPIVMKTEVYNGNAAGTNNNAEHMLMNGYDLFERPYAKKYENMNLSFHPVVTDTLSVLVPENHWLASKSVLSEEDLSGSTILAFPEGAIESSDQLREHLASYKVSFVLQRFNSMSAKICEMNGWLLVVASHFADRYAPLIPKPLSWKTEAVIGLVCRKNAGEAVRAYINLAITEREKIFS